MPEAPKTPKSERGTAGNIEDSQKILERLLAKGPRKAAPMIEEKKISADELSERYRRDKEALRETVERLRSFRGGSEKK